MDATWIEPHQQARAENLGYMVVEPEAVIATPVSYTHLTLPTTPYV